MKTFAAVIKKALLILTVPFAYSLLRTQSDKSKGKTAMIEMIKLSQAFARGFLNNATIDRANAAPNKT